MEKTEIPWRRSISWIAEIFASPRSILSRENYHSGRSRAVSGDGIERLAHSRAGRQDIIHDQHPAGKRGADEVAALP